MDATLDLALELSCLLGVYLVALALTAPLRRPAAPGASVPWRILFACVSAPLSVLVLTAAAVWVGGAIGGPESVGRVVPAAHLKAWRSFWILALLARLFEALARQWYARRGRAFPIPELIASILRAIVYGVVAFWILRYQLGIDIGPLLASTALLTAVIGFALQGVLGNLLSGISLHIVRSVMPGDWITVDTSEGQVVETNWRETRLRTTGGHMLVVPNTTMASAVVHNMTRPTPLRRHSIPVGASYSDSPADVIDALVAAALDVPDIEREPAPSAVLTEYKDFGINYELRFWTRRYHERVPINGEVARRIWYHFKRRGIEIPFPMSDKLLNDFMEVVYHQRRLPPERENVELCVRDLRRSDLVARLLTDAEGRPLLSDEELRGLAEGMRRLRYTRGETLFRQGDAGESCYVIAKGRVAGSVQAGSGTANRFELGPGSVVGEMSLVAGVPRAATISAVTEVEALEMSAEVFVRLLGLRPEIPERLSRIVAERAAANAEAVNRLKASQGVDAAAPIEAGHLLKRFMRLLGLGGQSAGVAP